VTARELQAEEKGATFLKLSNNFLMLYLLHDRTHGTRAAVQTAGTYINPFSALFLQETKFTVETTQTFAKPTRVVQGREGTDMRLMRFS
jgi:hypothetical protein